MSNNLLIELKREKAQEELNKLRERMNHSHSLQEKGKGQVSDFSSFRQNKNSSEKAPFNLNFIGGTNGIRFY